MKNEILGLRTVAYVVADLAKAKEWYTKAFNKAPYFDEPFYVGFNIGGYELGLMPEEGTSVSKGESILTYWGVEDINAAYNHMLECGVTVHEEPHNVGGPLEVASVFDPWKNIIGLICNPVFKIE